MAVNQKIAEIGIPVSEYIRRMRIDTAKTLLQYTDFFTICFKDGAVTFDSVVADLAKKYGEAKKEPPACRRFLLHLGNSSTIHSKGRRL